MTTRRHFLAALLAAGAAPTLTWADAGGPAFLACAKEPDGGFALFGVSAAGADTFRIPLPARGHAGAGHPVRPEAVAFARRPGTYALVIDCVAGRVLHRLEPPEGRQFNGHGMFLDGGRWLLTSEQMAETSEGRLGLWDVGAGYRRAGEMASGGIGPHEILPMPDGATIAVANGGIATAPDDRTKLNIATMRPNLAYVSTDGTLLERVETGEGLRRNSIRHLAVRGDGLLAFAMQWEGAGVAPPLLGLHRRGAAWRPAEAPGPEAAAMQGYAGSVAWNGAGTEVAITSPRGGRVHRFDPEGRFLGAVRRADVCGVAPREAGFLLTDGLGGVLSLDGARAAPLGLRGRAWDNHVVTL